MNKIFLSVFIVLAGCTTISNVTQLDRDTQSITIHTNNNNTGTGELLSIASQNASNFCAANGKSVVMVNYTTSTTFINKRDLIFNFKCV